MAERLNVEDEYSEFLHPEPDGPYVRYSEVEPLIEAARFAAKELNYAPPGESERDNSLRIKTKWMVERALKPFEVSGDA